MTNTRDLAPGTELDDASAQTVWELRVADASADIALALEAASDAFKHWFESTDPKGVSPEVPDLWAEANIAALAAGYLAGRRNLNAKGETDA